MWPSFCTNGRTPTTKDLVAVLIDLYNMHDVMGKFGESERERIETLLDNAIDTLPSEYADKWINEESGKDQDYDWEIFDYVMGMLRHDDVDSCVRDIVEDLRTWPNTDDVDLVVEMLLMPPPVPIPGRKHVVVDYRELARRDLDAKDLDTVKRLLWAYPGTVGVQGPKHSLITRLLDLQVWETPFLIDAQTEDSESKKTEKSEHSATSTTAVVTKKRKYRLIDPRDVARDDLMREKVCTLKSMLTKLGLSVVGKKGDLVERLLEHQLFEKETIEILDSDDDEEGAVDQITTKSKEPSKKKNKTC
jgi:hypothetical protein